MMQYSHYCECDIGCSFCIVRQESYDDDPIVYCSAKGEEMVGLLDDVVNHECVCDVQIPNIGVGSADIFY